MSTAADGIGIERGDSIIIDGIEYKYLLGGWLKAPNGAIWGGKSVRILSKAESEEIERIADADLQRLEAVLARRDKGTYER